MKKNNSFITALRAKLSLQPIVVMVLLLSVSALSAIAQTQTVSGVITDQEGDPLIGVTVMQKGTSNGTASLVDGSFRIAVTGESPALVVSYIGYAPKEIKVDGRHQINITLDEESNLIDEVVVIGYGTKKKATVAAAVSTVNGDDLTRSTSTTTAGALVGKVSGITARQNDGSPGAAATIQIRNMGTPLYVIDGIMKDEEAFNTLDIHDIENISILKDGAAAIYGVRAANGVVLITTRTGSKNQKPQVSINANVGWQQWTRYPRLLNAYEWAYGNYMKQVNEGTLYGDEAIANAREELEKWRTGYYNPETGEDYRGFDWYDNFVSKAAPQYSVSANISGGTDKFDYYFSIGHLDQQAVFKDFSYNRTNMQGNFNMQVSDRFKVGVSMLGKIASNINPALSGDDAYFQMRQSLFNLIPSQQPYANNNPNYLNYISPTHDSAHNMAAYTIDNCGKYQKTTRTMQTSLSLAYDIPVEGLTAKGLLSYYYYSLQTDSNAKSWNEYRYDPATDSYNISYTRAETRRTKSRNLMNEYSGQFTLDYNRTFASDHNVTALAGFEFFKQDYSNLSVSQTPVENPFVNLITTNENNTVSNSARNITTASWIFRAGYSFKNRYIIDFAGRYDASWRFQKGHQWGFFPSVSGAYRFSEEDFYKNWGVAEWMNEIKIRASYGQTGDDMASTFNSSYPDFAYMEGYTFGKAGSIISSNPLGNGTATYITGATSNGIPQTGLTWMKVSMLDLGIDLGFFNTRLRFEFDIFRRHRSGIPATPVDVLYPVEAGYSAMSRNLNSDEIRGLDLSLKWNDRIGRLSYWAGANLTIARQKTLKNYGELFYNAWDQYRWGQTNRWTSVQQANSGAMWMYETIGVFRTQEEIDNYPVALLSTKNGRG